MHLISSVYASGGRWVSDFLREHIDEGTTSQKTFSWHNFVHKFSVSYGTSQLSVKSSHQPCELSVCWLETILLHESLQVIPTQVALPVLVNAGKGIMNIERWSAGAPLLGNFNFLVNMEVSFEDLEK